jgi:PhnB protein
MTRNTRTDATRTGTSLHPRLIVKDGAAAVEFYVRAFGAEEVERHNGPDGKIVHAELRFGDVVLTLKDEEPGTPDLAPPASGSPVILTLNTPDADAVADAMERNGAETIYPVADHPYGRMGRMRDPFGHVWMLVQVPPG